MEVDFSPFLFTAATKSLGRVFFLPSFFIVFERTERNADRRRLSPCVKPQVLVVRVRPTSHHPPPLISLLATVLAFERCGDRVTNRALVKEETIPRSGGPLDSDLLIRQALSRLPSRLPLASGCPGLLLVCSRLWVEVTARRGKYSEGLSKPEASSHQRTGENSPKQPAG